MMEMMGWYNLRHVTRKVLFLDMKKQRSQRKVFRPRKVMEDVNMYPKREIKENNRCSKIKIMMGKCGNYWE